MSEIESERREWHYLKEGRAFGPVPEHSVRAWLESGFLAEEDLVWRTGLEQWTAIGELAEFGGGTAAPAAAEAPPAQGVDALAATPTPGAIPAVRYAGLATRFAALLIDCQIVNLLVSPLFLARWLKVLKEPGHLDLVQPDATFAVAFLLVALAYGTACESSPWRATLGKRAWRIQVSDLRGNRLSAMQAAARQMGKIVSFLGFGLGFVMAAITPRRQALHDLLTGCLVTRE